MLLILSTWEEGTAEFVLPGFRFLTHRSYTNVSSARPQKISATHLKLARGVQNPGIMTRPGSAVSEGSRLYGERQVGAVRDCTTVASWRQEGLAGGGVSRDATCCKLVQYPLGLFQSK